VSIARFSIIRKRAQAGVAGEITRLKDDAAAVGGANEVVPERFDGPVTILGRWTTGVARYDRILDERSGIAGQGATLN